MDTKKKCYIYTRVSTEMQVDGYSLEAQRERIIREARNRNMKVVGEYSDEGKSGKNIKGRPAFTQMLEDIKAGKDDVDYVLVFKLSRFGRNAADTLNSLQYMEDFGVNLLCVEDGIDSAAGAGKLIISVLAAVAEIERENIKEQTMAGRVQKAREGKWNGGQAPYGYDLVYDDASGYKVLVIDEDEAELIRLIFDKFINTDMGLNSLAKWLNDHGHTKKIRQNGTIERISANFVKNIIDNPVYMGKIAYGRRKNEKITGTRNEFHVVKQAKDAYQVYDGIHDGIIDENEWYKAQAKRAKNAFKRVKTHSLEHEHILSAIVRCPECGAPMYGVVNRKKKKGSEEYYTDMWYYHCKNRKMVTGRPCSYKKNIRQDQLNAEVMAVVKWALDDESFKQNMLTKLGSNEKMDELLAEQARLESEKEKASNKKKKLLSKITALDADDDLYDTMFEDLQGVLRDITEQIAVLDGNLLNVNIALENAKNESFSAEYYYKMLDIAIKNLDDADDATLKRIMNAFIEKIEVYPERQADGRWVRSIQFKIPFTVNGELVDTMYYDDDDDTENSLPYAKHDETVCLLSKLSEAKQSIDVKLDMDELDVMTADK